MTKQTIVQAATRVADSKKKQKIKDIVLDKCLRAELITKDDIKDISSSKQWLEDIIDLNILSLSLLALAEGDAYEVTTLQDVEFEVDAKVKIILKDIARRIMLPTFPYPVRSKKGLERQLLALK